MRTLRTELAVSFGILLGLVALVGVVGAYAVDRSTDDVARVSADVAPAVRANADVLQALTDAETGVRGYALSADPLALEPYRAAVRRLPAIRRELAAAVADEPDLSRLVERQGSAVDAWLDDYAEVRLDRPAGPETFDPELFRAGRQRFEAFRAANSAIDQQLRRLLVTVQDDARQFRNLMLAVVVVLTLVALLVGAVVSELTSRRLRRPLAQLRRVLARLTAGHLETVVPTGGPAEVEEISGSVNELAQETRRLRALEAAEREMQTRALLFGRQIRETLDQDEIVRAGLAELGRGLRVDRVFLVWTDPALRDPDRDGWRAPGVAAVATVPAEAPAGMLHRLREMHDQGIPRFTRDALASAMFASDAERDWARLNGIRGFLMLAVAGDEDVLGGVCCVTAQPRDWTFPQLRLAESIASDMSRALGHARLYADQQAVIGRLTELDRAKDEFVSSVSHELRTPLTSISGYVELLEDPDEAGLDPQQRRMVTVVRRNVDRLGGLIEDLLAYSRIEAGAFRTRHAPLDLTDVVRRAVEDIGPQADGAGLELRSSLPPHPVVVVGDDGQLSRALLNMLSNAVKFTPAGGSVEVALRDEAQQVVVEVSDTGIGIPAADLGHVFTRFFRARNAVSAEIPGTGLGLVIVRAIASNHGGDFRVESQEGSGTTAQLCLPHQQHT